MGGVRIGSYVFKTCYGWPGQRGNAVDRIARESFPESLAMRRKFAIVSRDDGAAVVEFAIVLGLILLSAVAAMALVGEKSERSLALLSNWELTESTAQSQNAATETRTEYAEAETPAGADADNPEPRLITVNQQALTAIFAALALMCYVAIRRHRISRSRAMEQLDDDRELLEQLDNKRYLKRQEILKVLAADPDALLQNRIEVRHLMSTRLRTVRPKTTLDEMRVIMAQEHVRHFPVLTEKGRLAGIVSDRDLMNHVAQKAADVMTSSLITVGPSSKLGSAISQMINRNISCLPVTEGDTLVGILTTTDAVLTLQCVMQLWQRMRTPEPAGQHSITA
jgi:CBS domain-containing protein/Flp pilus assembly pilin Flp